MKAKTKSPIKDKPLRYVAQSADEAIDDLLNEKIFWYYITVVLMLVIVANEWLRYYRPYGKPIFLTVLASVVGLFCGYKIVRHFKKIKPLVLGRRGERAVGQYLESFRESGAHVFHDILGNKFNVDHVVISNKGIYVMKPKPIAKLQRVIQ